MHPILRVALTALFVVALAWPLVFWGKPAMPDHSRQHVETSQPPLLYNSLLRHELYW